METTRGIADALIALLPPLVAALLASLLLLVRLRRERGYERRLGWYEGGVRLLHTLAYQLNVMVNVHRDQMDEPSRWPTRVGVHELDRDFAVYAAQAPLYASEETARIIQDAEEELDAMSDETDGWSDAKLICDKLDAIDTLADKLRDRAVPLAQAARRHLGLGRPLRPRSDS